jgi:hypothetical protein
MGFSGDNGETLDIPTRPGWYRIMSIAEYSIRLSLVNCCSAPTPAFVRTTATISPGCISTSTHFFNDSRMRTILSAESARSSTTNAMVRRTSSCLRPVSGGGGVAFRSVGRTDVSKGRSVLRTRMNSKFVIFWGLPSCRSSKSSGLRFVTGFPLESVTTASTWTRLTLIRMTPGVGGASWAQDCKETMQSSPKIVSHWRKRCFVIETPKKVLHPTRHVKRCFGGSPFQPKRGGRSPEEPKQ